MKIAHVTVVYLKPGNEYRVAFSDAGPAEPPGQIIFSQNRGIRTLTDAKNFRDDFVDNCEQFGIPKPVTIDLLQQVNTYLLLPAFPAGQPQSV